MSIKSRLSVIRRSARRILPRLVIGLSVLGLAPPAARAAIPQDQPAIERVNEIRNKLMEKDRADVNERARELVQWNNWRNWRNNWSNYSRRRYPNPRY